MKEQVWEFIWNYPENVLQHSCLSPSQDIMVLNSYASETGFS